MPYPSRHTTRQAGFTLIELLVTLSIGAIILSIAVPSFATLLRSNRAAVQANEVIAALSAARSESAKRGVRVVVCAKSVGADTCTGGTDWSGGWLVFADTSGNRGEYDGTDELLKVAPALKASPSFTATAATVEYRPTGEVRTAVTFDLVPANCENKERRRIRVMASGRASAESITC